jgi:hypothetical protein
MKATVLKSSVMFSRTASVMSKGRSLLCSKSCSIASCRFKPAACSECCVDAHTAHGAASISMCSAMYSISVSCTGSINCSSTSSIHAVVAAVAAVPIAATSEHRCNSNGNSSTERLRIAGSSSVSIIKTAHNCSSSSDDRLLRLGYTASPCPCDQD